MTSVAPASPAPHLWAETYEELRCLAAGLMAKERRNHTLSPTALVHEAYLRVARNIKQPADREQCRAAVVRSMLRALADYARTRHRGKRGGKAGARIDVPLDDFAAPAITPGEGLLREAGDSLARIWPERAEAFRLCVLEGLTTEEAAARLGVALRTAQEHLRCAVAFVRAYLTQA